MLIVSTFATTIFYYELGSVFCRGWFNPGCVSRCREAVTERFNIRVSAPSPVGFGRLLMRT